VCRLAIEEAAAIRANIDAAEDSRVAGDDSKASAILMVCIVDALPTGADVIGTPDRIELAARTDGIERRIEAI